MSGADDMRAAADKMLRAQYEPTGLVLHPIDHAVVGMDPAKPESIEHAKRIADAFGVPYWAIGIPGYRPPLYARLRGRWRRAVRAVRDAPGRLPGVQCYYDPSEGFGTYPAPRTGRTWVRVGRWQIGRVEEEEW